VKSQAARTIDFGSGLSLALTIPKRNSKHISPEHFAGIVYQQTAILKLSFNTVLSHWLCRADRVT
jgi:hypothetical protein